MSAVGDKAVVASLGMACQTSRQIRRHIRLLRDLTGDKSLKQSSLPFDWLICQPDSAARMLEDSSFFPNNADEIVYKGGRPWWERYNAYFWHEFTRKHQAMPIHEGFQNAYEKYSYLAGKFASLRRVQQRIFVVSNTQNNLDKVEEWTGTVDRRLNQESLRRLANAVDAFMGNGSNTYVIVSYESRIKLPVDLPRTKVCLIPEDTTEWEGSDDAWSGVFKDCCLK